jgi:hypothetical protein
LKFNNNFERRNLKYLRVYLKQPSPAWLEFTLREIQVYLKRSDKLIGLGIQSDIHSKQTDSGKSNPFDSFKNQIKNNLKNMKKEKDSNQQPYPTLSGDNGEASPREVKAMAKYHWTEEVPSFLYTEDVRKIDLHYNIL